MECELSALPEPSITWYNGDRMLSHADERLKMTLIPLPGGSAYAYMASLVIHEPLPENAGNYRCNARNEMGESNANIALNFAPPPQPEDLPSGYSPTFVNQPQIIASEDGGLVTFRVVVKARPAPQGIWSTRNKTIIPDGRRLVNIEEGDDDEQYVLTLDVKSPTHDDSGTYKCLVKNEIGEIQATLNLNIEGKR